MPEGRETPTPCDHGAHYGDGEGRRVCVECGATRPVIAPGERPADWTPPAREATP